MKYIVIERADFDFPCIVTDMETGCPKIFYEIEDAQIEANDCQDGIVVEI